MARLHSYLLLALLSVKVACAAPSDGKEIADKLGDDLSFASKQVIRGFTAIFAPILDTAQDFPTGFYKKMPLSENNQQGNVDATQNFQKILLRDGINAFGKGVKATATILSSPARVAGTGLEEVRKVGEAGLHTRLGTDKVDKSMPGNSPSIEDRTKITSALLNTTASEFSQANLGAVLLEVALKNRIKYMGNRTATFFKSRDSQAQKPEDTAETKVLPLSINEENQTKSPSRVDELIEQFNEAVRNNDERFLSALKVFLAQINPPQN